MLNAIKSKFKNIDKFMLSSILSGALFLTLAICYMLSLDFIHIVLFYCFGGEYHILILLFISLIIAFLALLVGGLMFAFSVEGDIIKFVFLCFSFCSVLIGALVIFRTLAIDLNSIDYSAINKAIKFNANLFSSCELQLIKEHALSAKNIALENLMTYHAHCNEGMQNLANAKDVQDLISTIDEVGIK